MFCGKELFHFSGYSRDSSYYNTNNMKKIGKMKDEMGGVTLAELVGLIGKIYLVLVENGKERKRAKGVNKTVVKHEIKHLNYLDCLKNEIIYTHEMKVIRSSKHNIYTIEQGKKSLVPYGDNRYLMNDGINTLLYGHYKIGFLN